MTEDEAAKKPKCAWCDGPTFGAKRTHDQVIRRIKGVPVVTATARFAPACAEHISIEEAPEPTVVRAQKAGRAGAWKKRQERMF